jgi:hypothetical protein
VVIRLCTDENNVIDYWNNIDAELEINMDVLDDFESEAKECHVVSTYCTIVYFSFFIDFFLFVLRFYHACTYVISCVFTIHWPPFTVSFSIFNIISITNG